MGLLKRLFGKKDAKPKPDVQEKTSPAAQYHVALNQDENSENYKMWRVRKSQSDKTIKHFKTQKEAIDYAGSLAKDSSTTVVIHKTDGSIRKQNYNKD